MRARRRLGRGRGRAQAVVTAAVLAAAAAAGAAGGSARAHGLSGHPPDMPAMAVLRSDLAPGAVLGHQGFSHAPQAFRAQYMRSFTAAQAPAGGPTFSLTCDLLLARSEAAAARAVALQRTFYASRPGRGLLAGALVAAIRHGRVRGGGWIGGASFAQPVAIGVGAGSFVVSGELILGTVHARAQFAELAVGPVAATLTFISLGDAVPLSTVSSIAAAVARHIAVVLTSPVPPGVTGVSGATPPTGTTSSTGPDGTTAPPSGPTGTTGTTGPTSAFGATGATPPAGSTGGG